MGRYIFDCYTSPIRPASKAFNNGTFSDLTTLKTLTGPSSLNMHRIRPILVLFNAEQNSAHF